MEDIGIAGRKRHTDSVLPLQGKVTGEYIPCVEKRSRLTGLLSRRNTASHRCLWPGHRALPLCPLPAGPGRRYGFSLLPFKRVKKNSGYRWAPTVKALYELPPVALPTSGKGSKQLLPLSPQAPLSFALLWHRNTGLSRPFFGKTGLDKRKTAAYTVPRKGVLGRGLRGGCIPSTSPDLGNANVGMRRKSDIFPQTGGVFAVGFWMNGRLSGVSPLRGSSAFFFRTTAAPER